MGYFLQASSRDYVILERSDSPGAFFASQPRHRRLISINKKHNFFEEEDFNLRHDWNSLLSDDPDLRFTKYSDDLFPDAGALQRYLGDFADRWKLNIRFETTVKQIDAVSDGGFRVTTTSGGVYSCDVLLMGLGAVAPWIPADIEGIELADGYEQHSLDRERYRNKRVGIIGQGNSAFETAEHLSGVAAFVHILAKSPVRMAWQTHFVGDVRAVNNNVYDMYQLKSLHAVLSPTVKRISRLPGGTLQTSHEYDYPNGTPPGTLQLTREYDVIIRCTGFRWVPDTLFDGAVRPNTRAGGQYPELTPTWESTNIPNLFFIGGAMQGNDRQAASGFIHGYRYNIRTLSRLLDERYERTPYPTTRLDPFRWDEFVDWMYERLSVSSALFQLFGVLCDTLVVAPDLGSATLTQELPLAEVLTRDFGDHHALVMTLEFGFHKFDEPSISFMGPSDPTNTECAAFLHPVIRYRGPAGEAEFHFGDSLLARWDRPHGAGGAVTSYHRGFLEWAAERLGLEINLPEPVHGGPYRRWPAEEVERWRREHATSEPPAPCKRPLGVRGHERS